MGEQRRVTGIGGVFLKSKDPGALSAWYERHLGLPVQPWGGAVFTWRKDEAPSEQGMTLWTPFAADTGYFAPSPREFMLNLRVDDLDAVLEALRAEGVAVLDRREDSEYGRFGYVVDPDGTLIELWQPPAAPPASAATP